MFKYLKNLFAPQKKDIDTQIQEKDIDTQIQELQRQRSELLKRQLELQKLKESE